MLMFAMMNTDKSRSKSFLEANIDLSQKHTYEKSWVRNELPCPVPGLDKYRVFWIMNMNTHEINQGSNQYSTEDEPLFDIRRFFGRQVIRIGNLIQADFRPEEIDDIVA